MFLSLLPGIKQQYLLDAAQQLHHPRQTQIQALGVERALVPGELIIHVSKAADLGKKGSAIS
jgi:hypothetical protein